MAAPVDPIGGVVPKAGGGVRVGLPPRAKFGTPGTRSARAEPRPKPKGPPPRRAASPRGGHHAPAPRPPAPNREPDLNEMTPAQRHAFATRTVRQNTQTELEPYKQRGAELGNQELATGRRYGAYGQAADTLIGQQQAGSEASAKSFLNQVADSTLKAEKGVETTGQNTQAGNAGYLDPQVAQALAAQRAVVAGTGAAQRGAAETTGQAETNYMSNLRAAAAQRVSEGQAGIAGQYGKLQGQNLQGENRLLGKVPGQIASMESEMAKTAFNQRATEAGLGLKEGALRQKGQETKARLGQSERASQRTAGTAAAGRELKKWEKQADLNFKETHPSGGSGGSGKSGGKPKAPSVAAGQKYMSNVSKAQSIAMQQGIKHGTPDKRLKEVRKYLQGLGYNADEVSASMNLAYYGRLGPKDRETAEAYGLNGHIRPEWWGHKKK